MPPLFEISTWLERPRKTTKKAELKQNKATC